MATTVRDLPDDVLGDVLRRLAPRSLAMCRSVCRPWRDAVDARRLLRADLLPRAVGGVFMHYCTHLSPELLSRPTTGPSISGDLEGFMPRFSRIIGYCNGLLLCTSYKDDYVANPATRRWARLPRRPPPAASTTMGEAFDGHIECLAYDPTLSPHYEVLSIPFLAGLPLDEPIEPSPMVDDDDHEMLWSEQPPSSSSYKMQVFSSGIGCWEERTFVREGGAPGGTIADLIGHAVYWRGALYLLCGKASVLRISISDAKYRLIPGPTHPEVWSYGSFFLGRSEKGVYCAFQYGWHGLRIFLLNESSCAGQTGWEFKHCVDLGSFARKLLARQDYNRQHKGPWILQDINYYRYPYGNNKRKKVVDSNFEWNSDDDDVVNTEDMVEGRYPGHASFIGFHPYKEIVFLDLALTRAVAYHWNTSKFQDLGNTYPKDYDAGHVAGIKNCFIYTPCWVDDLPERNVEAKIED